MPDQCARHKGCAQMTFRKERLQAGMQHPSAATHDTNKKHARILITPAHVAAARIACIDKLQAYFNGLPDKLNSLAWKQATHTHHTRTLLTKILEVDQAHDDLRTIGLTRLQACRAATISCYHLKHWMKVVLFPAYHQREARLLKDIITTIRATRKRVYQERNTKLTQAYRNLRNPQDERLVFRKGHDGTTTCTPQPADQLFTQQWVAIDAGTALLASADKYVQECCDTYPKYDPTDPPLLQPHTAANLQHAAQPLKETALGKDGFGPDDFKRHLSTQTCHWLACFYNAIEEDGYGLAQMHLPGQGNTHSKTRLARR